MRICPKCLEVFGSSFDNYCKFCGTKTVDTESKEGQKAKERKFGEIPIERRFV